MRRDDEPEMSGLLQTTTAAAENSQDQSSSCVAINLPLNASSSLGNGVPEHHAAKVGILRKNVSWNLNVFFKMLQGSFKYLAARFSRRIIRALLFDVYEKSFVIFLAVVFISF